MITNMWPEVIINFKPLICTMEERSDLVAYVLAIGAMAEMEVVSE